MRALAREVAFKRIFQSLFTSSEDVMDTLFEIDNLVEEEDQKFSNELVSLYFDNKEEVDSIIEGLLVDFSLDRIFKIDRAIISLATTEMKYYKNTPVAVVINEAVKMAKKFGSEKSYSFVNGILKSISTSL